MSEPREFERIVERVKEFEKQTEFNNGWTYFLDDLKTMLLAYEALQAERDEYRTTLGKCRGYISQVGIETRLSERYELMLKANESIETILAKHQKDSEA